MAEQWDDLQKGRFCLIFSTLCLSEVILNGIMGIFPGGFIGQGGAGQKFYLFPWLTQKFGDWNGQDFWTDSGFLSEQEYAFIVMHMFFTYIGLAYLRRNNDSEMDLRIDPDDWSWMKDHPITLQTLVPIGIMWLFVIAVFSIWAIILLAIFSFIVMIIKLAEIDLPIDLDGYPVNTSDVGPASDEIETSISPSLNSESTQTISDSVAGGDVVGGDKVVNDPETIAKVAIEAYRRGVSDSKD